MRIKRPFSIEYNVLWIKEVVEDSLGKSKVSLLSAVM